jgi:hypothetical protein
MLEALAALDSFNIPRNDGTKVKRATCDDRQLPLEPDREFALFPSSWHGGSWEYMRLHEHLLCPRDAT